MADIKESPPLFDTNETKVDDLDDDDEDIFASAVQVVFILFSDMCVKILQPMYYSHWFIFVVINVKFVFYS